MDRITELAKEYGRYGYRRITALLRQEGWRVNHKRVERLWRREGLKVPRRQPKRGRLWLTDGSCVRRRAERPDHVWSYDFVADRTHDGQPLRMLAVVDEYTRECLAIDVAREAQILIERWRAHYNRIRPHSALGYRPPAPEVGAAPATIQRRERARGTNLRAPSVLPAPSNFPCFSGAPVLRFEASSSLGLSRASAPTRAPATGRRGSSRLSSQTDPLPRDARA